MRWAGDVRATQRFGRPGDPERPNIAILFRQERQAAVNIIGPELHRESEIEQILRSLPRWFGIEEALVEYVADTATKPTFAAEIEGSLVGFVTLTAHFPDAWEVHCIAVAADSRNAALHY